MGASSPLPSHRFSERSPSSQPWKDVGPIVLIVISHLSIHPIISYCVLFRLLCLVSHVSRPSSALFNVLMIIHHPIIVPLFGSPLQISMHPNAEEAESIFLVSSSVLSLLYALLPRHLLFFLFSSSSSHRLLAPSLPFIIFFHFQSTCLPCLPTLRYAILPVILHVRLLGSASSIWHHRTPAPVRYLAFPI